MITPSDVDRGARRPAVDVTPLDKDGYTCQP
jgi:hypothetical protein